MMLQLALPRHWWFALGNLLVPVATLLRRMSPQSGELPPQDCWKQYRRAEKSQGTSPPGALFVQFASVAAGRPILSAL